MRRMWISVRPLSPGLHGLAQSVCHSEGRNQAPLPHPGALGLGRKNPHGAPDVDFSQATLAAWTPMVRTSASLIAAWMSQQTPVRSTYGVTRGLLTMMLLAANPCKPGESGLTEIHIRRTVRILASEPQGSRMGERGLIATLAVTHGLG